MFTTLQPASAADLTPALLNTLRNNQQPTVAIWSQLRGFSSLGLNRWLFSVDVVAMIEGHTSYPAVFAAQLVRTSCAGCAGSAMRSKAQGLEKRAPCSVAATASPLRSFLSRCSDHRADPRRDPRLFRQIFIETSETVSQERVQQRAAAREAKEVHSHVWTPLVTPDVVDGSSCGATQGRCQRWEKDEHTQLSPFETSVPNGCRA